MNMYKIKIQKSVSKGLMNLKIAVLPLSKFFKPLPDTFLLCLGRME